LNAGNLTDPIRHLAEVLDSMDAILLDGGTLRGRIGHWENSGSLPWQTPSKRHGTC
jgi:hypothetical protein